MVENGKKISVRCVWKIVVVCVGFFFTICAAVYGYGQLTKEVEETRKDISAHCIEDNARDTATKIRVRAVEDSTLRMEGDVSRIQADIREQKVLLKEIHDKVK